MFQHQVKKENINAGVMTPRKLKKKFTLTNDLFETELDDQSGLVHNHYFVKEITLQCYEYLLIRAHAFNWPYFVYTN